MARIFEQISHANANSAGKPDSNLANDANNLGGIPAEDYATTEYVQNYHKNKEAEQKKYIDKQDKSMLDAAKEHTNAQIRNQDFSNFAELKDVQILDDKFTKNLANCQTECANNLKTRTDQIVNDVNANFDDVNNAIQNLNKGQSDLFQSVSDGKRKVAEAITDKGVSTSATDTFDAMAGNIRAIPTGGSGGGGGTIPPGYVDTSDATATPYDILTGKTAYVKGDKITGILSLSGGGESGDLPSYNIGSVEKIYSSKADTIRKWKFDISDSNLSNRDDATFTCYELNGQVMNTYNLKISGDNLIIMNTDNSKSKTLNLINDLKLKSLTSDNDKTGTTENINYLCLRATAQNIEHPYLSFVVSKDSDEVIYQNGYGREDTCLSHYTLVIVPLKINDAGGSTLQVDIDTENITYTYLSDKTGYYRPFHPNGGLYGTGSSMSIADDGSKIEIHIRTAYSVYTSTSVLIFNIHPLINSANFETLIVDPSLNNSCFSFSKANEKLMTYGSNIFVKDSSNNWIKTDLYNSDAEYAQDNKRYNFSIINDGSYYICVYAEYLQNTADTKIEYGELTINYNTGKVSTRNVKTINLPMNIMDDYHDNYFLHYMASNKILLLVYKSKIEGNIVIAYKLDFQEVMPFTQLNNIYYKIDHGYIYTKCSENCFILDKSRFITDPDYSEIIGLYYDGEYYYRIKGQILSATAADVKKGKTFIGWNGFEETGTLEVENSE